MRRISIVVAFGEGTRVIGRQNDLPWSKSFRPDLPRLKPDIDRFKELTIGHPVIMGRRTWESIPERFRPLSDRTSIVVTNQQDKRFEGAYKSHSLFAALQLAEHFPGSDEIFVIGGYLIYQLALRYAHRIYETQVAGRYEGDTFFPESPEFSRVTERVVVPDFTPQLTFVTRERP